MSVPDYTNLSKNFFASNHDNYDLATNEGCGKYTEDFVVYARQVDSKIGHLKKNPGQTQYNGHANDAILYPTGVFNGHEQIYHAVDIIARAEQPHPWKSEEPNNPNAKDDPEGQWSEDKTTEYHAKDWTAEPNTSPGPKMVPWVAYNESEFNNRLQKQLAYDYGRRPQSADFQVSVWSARVFHSCFMGPEGTPLGFDAAFKKHRPEWCAELGVTVDDTWF